MAGKQDPLQPLPLDPVTFGTPSVNKTTLLAVAQSKVAPLAGSGSNNIDLAFVKPS